MNKLQPQEDMEKEKTLLECFIKSDMDAREFKRAIAVRMTMAGQSYNEISKILGVS
ncbi:MAG: helix-turn-helix domain-containing protein [Microcoleus sp. PH2017_21_RUC_O_A]|uniref:helix-turn-helix domain-containing protein n=1 Tax=Microcoleus sp. PH2017_21_RUC_O_A TaxID=2798832 RepID=UPI001E1758D2|nr:helix-turn-helix domain-containing protein [Microcoleus sp. PH2017_21_RUC_O_A]MCC3532421.1 helix-turn-helix domain-containing protein [Microcoleus sp. PH2017_21_RUC_O_A]